MMHTLTKNDYKILEELVSLSQNGLLKAMRTFLNNKYDTVIATKEYIYAVGDIPIALTAHLDTVFPKPVSNMYYDERKNTVWSPEGLGADDRAGVFAILQIVKSGLRPSILFMTDEESGCLGALSFTHRFKAPLTDINYIIELDRRGTNDCVFYDCDNPQFVSYVESFGFVENWGSCSDISILCPDWGIAGVNLSVGYNNEHSVSETLNVSALYTTISKVKTMLKETEIPKFEYVPAKDSFDWFKWSKYAYEDEYWSCLADSPSEVDGNEVICKRCKNIFRDTDTVPVKNLSGGTSFYCPDCAVDAHIVWCNQCNEAFESNDPKACLCPDCQKKVGGSKH